MSDQSLQKTKHAQITLITLFLVLSLLPVLAMLVVGQTQPSANEILSSKPQLVRRDGSINTAVLNDFSDYIADRFAFRKQLVTAWSGINSALFRSSAEDQVVLGREDWLFFEPTLDDYMGRSMSENELRAAASYLAALQNDAESRGAQFYFTIAPNKNSLYGSYMPAYIPENHAASNAERIKPYLEEFGVNYVDLFSVFSERGEVLYYHGDSHWTARGAALAADRMLEAMGKSTSYFEGTFIEDEPHKGDLYEMLYPVGEGRETSEKPAGGFSFTLASDPNGGNAMKIVSSCEGENGSLVCWRDSFGISLYPYLADSFENAVFLRSSDYDMEMIDTSGADVVLIEIVERNLKNLAAAAGE